MNTKEMNGKQISRVDWPDTAQDSGIHIKANEGLLLEMSATYHGNRDEFWIVEYHKINGEFREVARHNPKYIDSFRWA